MREFLETWGGIARNISLIVSGIGMLFSVIVYLNKLKSGVEKIPGLLEQTEEITEKVKTILEKKSALHRRLVHAFPEMKMRIREKIKNKIN